MKSTRRSGDKSSSCELMTNPEKRRAADRATDAIKDRFPAGLARPALRALLAANITRLESLRSVTEGDLRAMHGMGPKAVDTLKQALADRGMQLRG